ncbi:phosphotransferase [Ferroacidibacillus organovorans]|uniref:Aminoglycoside phosphotransferase domain-containing protein n=1 Tax=Ferroacidibacillus organovorans TaxID=1765683 RepID=A0A1V4ER57_9BACL|nr:phosphotransferase [Ferroacidibacillus organovorans]OPG15407.1 hypothetical protein B2M26_12015 [Ferroacidibacillus organovorans]
MKLRPDDHEFDELCEVCQKWFEFTILDAQPIVRGWLNRKWKLDTTHGVFLIKSYHPDRYRLYDESALVRALRWQSELHTQGLPCPQILMHQGAQLHSTPSGQRFMVMTFCDGERFIPGQATYGQMHSLGAATGQMHRFLLMLGGFPTQATFLVPEVPERIRHFENVLKAMEQNDKHELYAFAQRQLNALQIIDIREFRNAEIGFAHRDLWADNMLFSGDRLSAILDFDRLNADYLDMDIARAILSGNLDGETFNVDATLGFLDGYRTQREYPTGGILRALRMVWYMESAWWITPNMDQHTVPPQRFAHEMDWLARNMQNLPSLLS